MAEEEFMTRLIRYVREVSLKGLARSMSGNLAPLSFRLQKYRRERQDYE